MTTSLRSYLLRRLSSAALVLWGVVTIVFLLLHIVPGDPVDLMLGESATNTQRDDLRHALGLDEPLPKQYGTYLLGLTHGNFGTSLVSGEAVSSRLQRHFPATLELSAVALLIAVSIAIPLGVLSAARAGSTLDGILMTGSLLGLSMPAFWLGPVLILIFSFHFGWFPMSGRSDAFSVVLPALTLGTGMAALLSRMTRSSVLEVLREDFVRTARAKGLGEGRVLIQHVLRNAWLPILTVIGLQAGALLAGSIVTEKIFSWPGIGLEMVEAIERRDYPVVQGCVLWVATAYVLITFVVDVAYAWLDPRVRLTGGASK